MRTGVVVVLSPLLARFHDPVHLALHVPRGLGAFLPGTVLAAVAAVLFAIGSVLQHDAATSAADESGLRFREMVRRPTWAVGQLCTIAGSGLQVTALALAPVAIVQPLLAGSLVVALALRSLRFRCRPTGSELLGAGLTAGGLAVFLVAARPAPGGPDRLPHPWAVIGATLLGVAVVAAATRTRRGATGAVACGVVAGLAAGIAAVLISAALKIVSSQGFPRMLAGPELWGAIVMAVAAQVGAQQAFCRGALTWSLPALTVLDPLTAVPAARFLLGERLEPGHAAVWLPAGLVAALGIIFLARSDDACRQSIGASRRISRSAEGRAAPHPSAAG
jgi:drug/metabolite transporter (DMT)-like permease